MAASPSPSAPPADTAAPAEVDVLVVGDRLNCAGVARAARPVDQLRRSKPGLHHNAAECSLVSAWSAGNFGQRRKAA